MLIEMAQKGVIAEKKFEGLTANSVQSYHNLFKVWNDWLASEKVEHIRELSSRIATKFLP